MQPPEADQAGFSESPKTFNSVNVRLLISELIGSVFNTKVILITQIDQAIISSPSIGVNNTF